jgi:arylsulfatase A-like enzyme
LTGLYPGRTHVTDWIPGQFKKGDTARPLMPPDWTQKLEHRHVTIAEALKEAGYRTAHVGKWHLTPASGRADIVEPYYPQHHGFDRNVAGNQWGSPGSYFWPFRRPNAKTDLAARVANFPDGGKKGDYLTDTLTGEALRVIEEYRADPFFLYFPFYAVHTPIEGKPELVAHYKERLRTGRRPDQRHTNPTYAALVTAVDQAAGRIVAKLDELGIADRTAIILTGDNGGLEIFNGPTNNDPLRAGKGSAYEGGVRVPLIVHVPGMTPQGVECDEPAVSVDFYPTILALTGTKSEERHNDNLDGVSLLPVLQDPKAKLDREAIYWHYPHYHAGGAEPYSAVRAGDWRLVEFYRDGHAELYNLAKDIGETHDLSAAMPEKTRELRKMLHAWREKVDAQPPRNNSAYVAPQPK